MVATPVAVTMAVAKAAQTKIKRAPFGATLWN